ncbi:MAG: sigma-54 dependent transcriptional regulator [Gemmatimonadaceae bacterium]|nr:sigma-54 dependent transcriptional regulator [Gemmatimonadaceae bacterium]
MSNAALYTADMPTPAPMGRLPLSPIPVRAGAQRERPGRQPAPGALTTSVQAQLDGGTRTISRVLVVTQNDDAQAALRATLEADGREVLHATQAAGVVDMIARAEVDLVVSDAQLPDHSGLTLLLALRDAHPTLLTVLLSDAEAHRAAQQAAEHGAADFLSAAPVDAHEVGAFLRRAEAMQMVRDQQSLRAERDDEVMEFRGMYGTTPVMREVFRMISRVGRTDVTVLVTGESGTGKELVARALHEESSRRNKPFVALNCSALPSELVESELFGHTRGAFTGAVKDRGGLFEAAHGGTLFLDEIGDLGALAQAKVLRALENGEVMRVGGTKTTRVDVRVLAATNRPLDEMVSDGRFREDLLYRLKVISLALPPLRDRKADLPLLATHFLSVFAERHGLPLRVIGEDAREILMQYDWPGNVRELRNVIEGALVMCDGAEIAACDLPVSLMQHEVVRPLALLEQSADLPFVEARERALREFDRAFLSAALARNGGNIARTARALGLHRQSLQKLLARRDLRNA